MKSAALGKYNKISKLPVMVIQFQESKHFSHRKWELIIKKTKGGFS